jgi:hypothetical protein
MAESRCFWQCPQQWSEWSEWVAAGLHGAHRWRLPVLLVGILFAHGRRTVTTWLRAVGISDDFDDYYYFLASVGRKSESVATQLLVLVLANVPLPERLLAVIDDSPTKRYGPKVEGADIHRNPTPGPADQKYLYGHIWVTISLAVRHPLYGALALPLRSMLYVRQQSMAKIPKHRHWRFRTKLCLAAKLVEWIAPIVGKAGKTLWVVVDGFYTKWPFLNRALVMGVVVVGRLRHDAALRGLPPKASTWSPAQIWQAQDQLGQAGRAKGRLANGRMYVVRPAGNQDHQDVLGHVSASPRPDPSRAREGASWLVRSVLDRSLGQHRGNSGGLRRPGDHRAGLSRREGSLGRGPAAGPQHLDQRSRVSIELVDAYAGRTMVLGPQSRPSLRP